MRECKCEKPRPSLNPRLKNKCNSCGFRIVTAQEEIGRLHTAIDAALTELYADETELRDFVAHLHTGVKLSIGQKFATWKHNRAAL